MVDPDDYQAYYDVVANQTLWFCLHGLWDLPRRPAIRPLLVGGVGDGSRPSTSSSRPPRRPPAAEGATVLVQDYHLALVPALLAARGPDVRIAAFVHTPWCSPQELSVLPDEVAAAILVRAGRRRAVWVPLPRWAAAFEACCETQLGRPPATFVSPAAAERRRPAHRRGVSGVRARSSDGWTP